MPDAENQKEVVQGFQPDNDECDFTIVFHVFLFENPVIWNRSLQIRKKG